uniref:Zinc finger, CCHC-type n=1 Tax=Tanacetum cinerariifolium TaxID=118510 RepID=A0A6L2P312_TANCI|nr:zinc finger, CCHC-type [Tanacetum cinerariifolium]
MCDNKAAIQISKNLVQHDITKHVEVDRHFIREKLEAGIIELPFVKSSDQLADILTKAVGIVGKLSRYTSNLGTQHWQAIQQVLKYLKKTIDYKLTFTGYPSVLEGYTDASWISNFEDNSSSSGCVFLLGGAAGKEGEWLKSLLLEILLWSKPIAPIFIRCDSVATLAKAYSQMYNEKSRHLGVRHSMIRELIANGMVSIKFVRSQQNIVDHLRMN